VISRGPRRKLRGLFSMFDPVNFQMYWPRPYIGGPRCGEYANHSFVSVPYPGYQHALWFAADGNLICEIYQHESTDTPEAFAAAVSDWQVQRSPDAADS
jgi:hypothetical protein